MFKDPDQQGETPYEVLDVAPEASLTQVNRSLHQFLRNPKNIPKVPRAQQALQRLKNARERVAVDVWFYDVDVAGEKAGDVPAASLSLEEYLRAPLYAAEDLCSDLDMDLLPVAAPPGGFLKMKFSDLKCYDGITAVELQPEFDC